MNWENRKEEGWKLSFRPLSSFSIPLLLLLPARASLWLYPKPAGEEDRSNLTGVGSKEETGHEEEGLRALMGGRRK